MTIRIVSLILSLLAHGSVFLYVSSQMEYQRPARALPGQSLKLSVLRTGDNPLITQTEQASEETHESELAPQPPAEAVEAMTGKQPPPTQPEPRPPVTNQTPPSSPPEVTIGEQHTTRGERKRSAKQSAEPVEVKVRNESTTPKPKPKRKEPATPQQEVATQQQVIALPLESVRRPEGATPMAEPFSVAKTESLTSTTSDTSAADAAARQRLRDIEQAYTEALIEAIERHKRYPLRARRRGEQGEVGILFTLLADGRVVDVRVMEHSGSRILDRAAFKALESMGRFRPIPPELDRQRWEFRVPIRFVMQ